MDEQTKINEMLDAFGLSKEDFEEMFSCDNPPQTKSVAPLKVEVEPLIPPKGETVYERHYIDDELRYAVTAGPLRECYYLCRVENNKCIKTGHKSANPCDLSEISFGNNNSKR